MKLIISSILLGFGGFDPMGAVIIMTALAHKVPKKNVYLFSLMALISTTLFGTLFSSGIGTGANYLSGLFNQIPDMVYVVLDFVIAIAAGTWLINRVFFKEKSSEKEDKKESKFMGFARKSMPLAGFLFGFWAMSDPTFWTVVALTAKDGNLFMRILCSAIWMVIGQLPLYALTIAIIFGAHDKLIQNIEKFLDTNNRREKLHRIVEWVINIFVLAIIAYFLINPILYLVNGKWV